MTSIYIGMLYILCIFTPQRQRSWMMFLGLYAWFNLGYYGNSFKWTCVYVCRSCFIIYFMLCFIIIYASMSLLLCPGWLWNSTGWRFLTYPSIMLGYIKNRHPVQKAKCNSLIGDFTVSSMWWGTQWLLAGQLSYVAKMGRPLLIIGRFLQSHIEESIRFAWLPRDSTDQPVIIECPTTWRKPWSRLLLNPPSYLFFVYRQSSLWLCQCVTHRHTVHGTPQIKLSSLVINQLG